MTWHAFRDAKTRAAWRDELMRKQNGLCAICGNRFPKDGELSEELQLQYAATFDHIIPRSRGGQDDVSNLQLVHRGCNRARGGGSDARPLPSVPRVLRSQ